MRAVVMRQGRLVLDTVPDPEPEAGEVLVRTLACGICGSDLHALRHADAMVAAAKEAGAPSIMDPARDVVMGHEFCAEVVDHGPGSQKLHAPGTRVVSMPVTFRGSRIEPVGYSNEVPGGYGELMTLSEMMLIPVPNGLPTEIAALTEPLGVGIHAVAKSEIEPGGAAIVVGCGPVGLAVIAALRLRGVSPVVAADFSPKRRSLAGSLGADVVVDPREDSPYAAFGRAAGAREAAVFECVGVPGLLQSVMRDAPHGSKIVVAGACMEEDRIKPLVGIQKELSLQFVLGYTPEEFASAVEALADGQVDGASWITGSVGLDGVAGAFDDLGRPETHVKILVEPAVRKASGTS